MRNIHSYDHYILDLGGVIINIDYERAIQAFAKIGAADFEKIYNQFAQSDIFDRYETGKISSQHFVNKILDILPNGTTPNQVVEAWNAMILDLPIERIELINELRAKGKKVYMLSNINDLHHAKAWRVWSNVHATSPEDTYDKIYLSHIIGRRKPDPQTFTFVCSDLVLQPSEVLFIDDSIQHIKGAHEAGLDAILLERNTTINQLFS